MSENNWSILSLALITTWSVVSSAIYFELFLRVSFLPPSDWSGVGIVFMYESKLSMNLFELLHVYTPFHTLHYSSDTRMLKIQQYKRKTHGFRTFSCFGPHIWNSLPQDLNPVIF